MTTLECWWVLSIRMEREFWSNSDSCIILNKSKQCLPFNFFDDVFNAKGFHVKAMDIWSPTVCQTRI